MMFPSDEDEVTNAPPKRVDDARYGDAQLRPQAGLELGLLELPLEELNWPPDRRRRQRWSEAILWMLKN